MQIIQAWLDGKDPLSYVLLPPVMTQVLLIHAINSQCNHIYNPSMHLSPYNSKRSSFLYHDLLLSSFLKEYAFGLFPDGGCLPE